MKRLVLPASVSTRAAAIDADQLCSRLGITATPSVPYTMVYPGNRRINYHYPFVILHMPRSALEPITEAICSVVTPCINALLSVTGSVLSGRDGGGAGQGANSKEGSVMGTVLYQAAKWSLPIFSEPHPLEDDGLDILLSRHYFGTREIGMDVTVAPYPGVPVPVWRIFVEAMMKQAGNTDSDHPLAAEPMVQEPDTLYTFLRR
ncbi:hypothetical protein K8B33_05445 [Alcanivorax sp. JB21]|uniref:hypothetical protein n=1 Tax=Alcanivorax limicola TaxID=2874102 RepID=UPI001CBEE68B|nr:hypothetical protein [Alcanivorax limicola]MBZ2188529.1 hypothetical protein [Alcanivorax limicola]